MTDPEGLWQASLEFAGEPGQELLEALETLALSASIFEAATDKADNTTRWRVDLLFAERPDEATIRDDLERLLEVHGLVAEGFALIFLPHEDWLEAVRMHRPAMRLGRFLVHGPDDPVPAEPRTVPVLMEAGLAFGSGEHATTSACLLVLDRLLRHRRFSAVLDMGCGSAILAIAAARAGCRLLLAVDNDPLAVAVARENIRRNGVSGRVVALVSEGYADLRIRRPGPFDLVLANILADPLVTMAPALRRHLAPGGFAVLSGLLETQAPVVIAAHRAHGLRLVFRIDRTPWTALVMKRPSPPRHRQGGGCGAGRPPL